jgi:hypothetical protein
VLRVDFSFARLSISESLFSGERGTRILNLGIISSGLAQKSVVIKSVVVCQFDRAPVFVRIFSADFVSAGTKRDTVVVPAG